MSLSKIIGFAEKFWAFKAFPSSLYIDESKRVLKIEESKLDNPSHFMEGLRAPRENASSASCSKQR